MTTRPSLHSKSAIERQCEVTSLTEEACPPLEPLQLDVQGEDRNTCVTRCEPEWMRYLILA